MSNLITLARAKEAIPTATSAEDAILSSLIAAASAAIEAWCRRRFVESEHTEILDGGNVLPLAHPPIASVRELSVLDADGLEVVNTASGLEKASVQTTATSLILRRTASGVETTNSITFVAEPTLGDLAAAVAAIGNGWQAEVASPARSNWASASLAETEAAVDALTQPARLALWRPFASRWTIDHNAGILFGPFPGGCRNLRARYTGGFAEVPEAIQQACALLTAMWFFEREHDYAALGETLGDHGWRRRFETGGVPLALRALLEPYRLR